MFTLSDYLQSNAKLFKTSIQYSWLEESQTSKDDTISERVTRVEERTKHLSKNMEKQVKSCMGLFKEIKTSINVINEEQGETRNLISDLKFLINKKVSAPMSGRDRATIYVALVVGVSGIIISLINVFA